MDAERGALKLARLIGTLLIVVSLLEVMLTVADAYAVRHPHPVPVGTVVLWSLPAVAGIVILIKAQAVADWISNILDL
jgi:hypothetical protein